MKVKISYKLNGVPMIEEFEAAPNMLDCPDDVEGLLVNLIRSSIALNKEDLK